jgi:PBP1b-binding outer membrane lipoprotein LpoB
MKTFSILTLLVLGAFFLVGCGSDAGESAVKKEDYQAAPKRPGTDGKAPE